MQWKSGLPAILGTLLIALLHSSPTHAQATRTWVSGVGDDANPCSRTAPCKTFAGAISRTAAGGEIDCLDPGGFGTVTITKAITIDCSATFGSALASGTVGISISPALPAGSRVTLRGLSVNGTGTGTIGVRWLAGSGQLHIENLNIFCFAQTWIDFEPTGTAELYVSDTVISDNGTLATNGGIVAKPSGAGIALTALTRVQLNNNSTGAIADTTATSGFVNFQVLDSAASGNGTAGFSATSGPQIAMTISKSMVIGNTTGISSSGTNTVIQLSNTTVTGNGVGLSFASSGKIKSFSSNVISGNLTTDGVPTSTVPSQ